MKAKEQLKQTLSELKSGTVEAELNARSNTPSGDKQTHQTNPRILSTVCSPYIISYTVVSCCRYYVTVCRYMMNL